MKKMLFTILLFGFGIWGCSENTNITAPENNEVQKSFLKIEASNSSVLMKSAEVSKVIDGDKGGLVRINLVSEEEEFGARGWLYFPRGSFDGKETIKIKMADDEAALDFEPSGIPLDLPARLTLKFNGVIFDDVDDDKKIDFYYIDENEELSEVNYRKLIVNREEGWVIVIDARLAHFSRYGFTK